MIGRSRKWWVHFRGDVYAMDMTFPKAISEREWREWLREYWGYHRLPAGTSVWGSSVMKHGSAA